MDKITTLRSLFDPTGFGLEIGPLNNPVAPRRDGYRVEILDHANQADLQIKYGVDPNVDCSLIEHVDYISDGRPMVEIIGKRQRFDWIVASHVVEHTPDLLGFLRDCEELLKPGGVLVLAVPHKRFCFDAQRPVSTIGSILQAHYEKRTRHPPGAVFDFIEAFVERGGCGAWGESFSHDLTRKHEPQQAMRCFTDATQSSAYIDVHGWVFLPSSFRLIVEELHGLGLLGLREKTTRPTWGCEFYISLSTDAPGPELSLDQIRRCMDEEELAGLLERFRLLPGRWSADFGADAPGGDAAGSLVATALRSELLAGKAKGAPIGEKLEGNQNGQPSTSPDGNPDNVSTSQEVERLMRELAAKTSAAARLADEVQVLQRKLSNLESSTIWRATAPARTLVNRLRGQAQ